MKLQIALPASALVLALTAVAWVRAPRPQAHSPKQIVARAGFGAIQALARAGTRNVEPEPARSAAPLTLAPSRPDSVGPVPSTDVLATIERYHEQAIATARAKSLVVIADSSTGTGVKSLALADFEKKCVRASAAATKKSKCTKAALDMPRLGCYLEQAASALAS